MLKVVTHFSTLMRLAHALGQAKKQGNADEVLQAQQAHDAYVALMRTSETTLGLPRSALS